jgi:MoaA/NifB/PqqE/SkfB family radical SAM enzyme
MKPGRELTVDEVAALFTKVGRLDVVRLTGGEPFLREDLLPLAEAVQHASRPEVLHLTTNGSFPERVAELVRGFSAPGRLSVMVSVDGLAEEQERSRGAAVGLQGVMDTVERLVALRRSHGVSVSVNHTVVSPQSMRDHAPLRARFAALGVDVQTVLAYADSAMYGLKLRGKRAEHLIVPRGYPLHPALAGVDAIGFVERELDGVAQIENPLLRWGKRYYLRGLLARLRGDEAPRPRPRCVALRSHLRLLPDGSVPVCQFNTETVGELRTGSFEAVWRGQAARAARRWVDDCPGCWAECEVMPSALYTADVAGMVARGG